jgi:ATP-dependent DNA ligase
MVRTPKGEQGKSAFVGAAPTGKDWLHEIKCDGYRMHARIDDGQVKVLTRTMQQISFARRTSEPLTSVAPLTSAMSPANA